MEEKCENEGCVADAMDDRHAAVLIEPLQPRHGVLQAKVIVELAQARRLDADAGPGAVIGIVASNLLDQQTRLLGFMDCFRAIGLLTIVMVPVVFFIRSFKVGGKAPAGH